jgi:hypothetical protein
MRSVAYSGSKSRSIAAHPSTILPGSTASILSYLRDVRIDQSAIRAHDVFMKRVQVVFSDLQMERLRLEARFEDRPISKIIRRATEDYLRKMPLSPRPDAAAAIPVFDGGDTLVGPERFRELAYSH